MMVNRVLSQRLLDVTASVESIIHLGAMTIDPRSMPDHLKELMTESSFDDIEQLFGMPKAQAEQIVDDCGDEFLVEAIIEHLHEQQRLGFLVQITTPIMTKHERGRSGSWGFRCSKWVYSKTFGEAVAEGLKFVAEQRAEEDAKFAAEEGGAK